MSPPAPLHALKVLLVEADPVSRTSLALMLRNRGAEVVAVRSATEALTAIRQFNSHLYLINLRLPGEDGRSLIRRIRALPPEQGGSTPAIALTTSVLEDEEQSLVAGFQVQLMQPFLFEQLLASIMTAVNHAFASDTRVSGCVKRRARLERASHSYQALPIVK